MKVVVDTNVLVRAVVRDDKAKAKAAIKVLRDAELIAIAVPCLMQAEISLTVLLPTRGIGSAAKPSFHSTKKRLRCSRRKDSKRAYCPREETTTVSL